MMGIWPVTTLALATPVEAFNRPGEALFRCRRAGISANEHDGENLMTPEDVDLVQTSFKKVVPIADTAADLFYDRLFAIAPEARALFPQDMKEQKKKLIAMLATAVDNLHQVNAIVPAVEELGKRHLTYGVTAQHYEPVGAALLWTLEQGLGDAFTPPLKAAWTEAYLTLAGVMQKAAAAA
jgi:hemoglobin-like flavoprotein